MNKIFKTFAEAFIILPVCCIVSTIVLLAEAFRVFQ